MTINSYFKTTEEINQLFQKAFDTLEQHGYDATTPLFEEAFRHDPYRLQAHYKLALYFASTQSADRFKEHFFICWNIDAAYKEKITTDAIVINALGNELIAEIVAAKELQSKWGKREFASVDPAAGNTWLLFKLDPKKAIHDVYVSLDETTTKYFRQPEFDQLDGFELGHWSDWEAVDCSPEALYTALQRLSEYVDNNVRFLVTSEWDEFIDEVIILNGAFHIYRHQTGARDYYARLEFIETIINSYPEDGMLRSWLCKEYQTVILYRIGYDMYDTEFLDKAIHLSTPEDPWMPYILGKLSLHNHDIETAIKRFKEAAEKTCHIFEVYHLLGTLQVLYTIEYSESIQHLSVALGIKKDTTIYLHRALAYYKLGENTKANTDIESFICDVEPFNNGLLVTGGYLLSDAGYELAANTLFNAALEKNILYENERREKINADGTNPDTGLYDDQLFDNTKHRVHIYTGLSINATSREAAHDYALKAITVAGTDIDLCEIATLFEDRGRFEEAEQCYDGAIEQYPEHIIALNKKSIIRLQQKDYEAALKLANQALEMGYEEEALQMVKKVLLLEPSMQDQIINDPQFAGLIIPDKHDDK